MNDIARELDGTVVTAEEYDAWRAGFLEMYDAERQISAGLAVARFELGSKYNEGEDTYGEHAALDALPDDGRAPETVRKYSWIARKVPEALWNRPVEWSCFDAVASLPAPEQEKWLGRVEEQGLTVAELRKGIKAGRDPINDTSKDDEYGTPSEYVEAAREVMGEIDLDPATSELFNQIVQAAQIFTEQDDGLAQEWHGRVFLNPPYSKAAGGAGQWLEKLIAEYEANRVTEAVFLANAVTGEQWFQPVWQYARCFTRRINFYTEQGDTDSQRQGSVFVYLGPNVERFEEIFSDLGHVELPPGYGIQPELPEVTSADEFRVEEQESMDPYSHTLYVRWEGVDFNVQLVVDGAQEGVTYPDIRGKSAIEAFSDRLKALLA